MTSERASALKAVGMTFAVRYLGSITAEELQIILGAGLLFMPVTFSRAVGWVPTPGMGTSDGNLDVRNLKAAGIPQGVTTWIDLEGTAGNAQEVSAWVIERATVLNNAGYNTGLYVGAECGLTGDQLYALPNINRYWRSLSDVIPPSCGWCLMQAYKTITLAGTEIDVDYVQYDYEERLPMMVAS
jgi:hypothetical protein